MLRPVNICRRIEYRTSSKIATYCCLINALKLRENSNIFGNDASNQYLLFKQLRAHSVQEMPTATHSKAYSDLHLTRSTCLCVPFWFIALQRVQQMDTAVQIWGCWEECFWQSVVQLRATQNVGIVQYNSAVRLRIQHFKCCTTQRNVLVVIRYIN